MLEIILADPFCCRLDLFVMDVSVAQCHRNLAMTEKLRNRREREALHDGVGGEGVPEVMSRYVAQAWIRMVSVYC